MVDGNGVLFSTKVTRGVWRALGERLETAGITRIDHVARELADRRSTALAAWPLEKRRSILVALEEAFLDPTGVLRAAAGTVPSLEALQDRAVLEAYSEGLGTCRDREDVRAALVALAVKAVRFRALTEVDQPFTAAGLVWGDPGFAILLKTA